MTQHNIVELDAVIQATDIEHQDAHVALTDDERQPCEVWTRVMGYHRPVASFNPGKQSEFAERKFFTEQRAFASANG